MIKMKNGELELQGTLSELVMDWLLIGRAMREGILAKNIGVSSAVDDILRDMTETVINHGKKLIGAELNLGAAVAATAEVASTVAKFARLQDEENKEAGQEDD